MKVIYEASFKFRVRYSETDKMGYCYYGNYASYFEVARVEALREIGLSYADLEERGVGLPVKDYSVAFKRPAKYDDEIEVRTKVHAMDGLSLGFSYETLDKDGALLNHAETTLVFVDLKTGRPMRVPDDVQELLT